MHETGLQLAQRALLSYVIQPFQCYSGKRLMPRWMAKVKLPTDVGTFVSPTVARLLVLLQ
jgi:hypothetical protein